MSSSTKRRIPTSNQSSAPNTTSAAVSTRIVSGSVGSLITALAVTPLEVVKVHLQSVKPSSAATSTGTSEALVSVPKNVSLCPKGCGTFVLNNGLFDCVLPKSSVPYFDKNGKLKCLEEPLKKSASMNTKARQKLPLTMSSTNQLGTFAMIRQIFIKEGFQGIYAGLAPTLVMGIPSTVFYYSVYDELVARARSKPEVVASAVNPWVPLLAGSSARLLATIVTAPLELVRTRQASAVGEGKQLRGMTAEFQAIVGEQGPTALYKGLAPTLWRDVPFSGIYWLCYEQFRQLFGSTILVASEENFIPTPLQQSGISFLSGASAGMVAAACTTPFDVVKTRQQAITETVQTVARSSELAACCNHGGHIVYRAESQDRANSVFAYMRTIYETEGIRGLWRGNQARMIKVAPSCAIMITSYEFGKRLLESTS